MGVGAHADGVVTDLAGERSLAAGGLVIEIERLELVGARRRDGAMARSE
jgi:hypothetical protein